MVAIDWRGQGLSDRYPDAGNLGHVNDFNGYQNDLEAVLQHEAVLNLPAPRTLFCHSMGGCIGLRSLVEGFEADRAVFSAPMWGVDLSWLEQAYARALSFLAGLIGQSAKLAPRQSTEPYILTNAAEENVLTTDIDVFRWFRTHLEEHPELAVAGTTIGWLGAALREMSALSCATPPKLPVLVLLGTEESVVSTDAVHRQIERMPTVELMLVDRARHEVWMESEAKQAAIWRRIDEFLKADG